MNAFYFASNGVRLFGILHRPPSPRLALIFCNPYGGEMVCGYGRFARWAKELEQDGIAVLRFHYRGTGESAGSSGEFDFEAACTDTEAAVTWMREHLGGGQVGLFGYRFGATVAARVAARMRPDVLLLWAPVLDTPAYAREILRLRLTLEVVHRHHTQVPATRRRTIEQLEAGQCVDVLGYDFSPAFHRQLLAKNLWEPPDRTQVLWLARAQEGNPGADQVREWQAAKVEVDYRAIPEIVFWEKFPPELPAHFAAVSRGWLREWLGTATGTGTR